MSETRTVFDRVRAWHRDQAAQAEQLGRGAAEPDGGWRGWMLEQDTILACAESLEELRPHLGKPPPTPVVMCTLCGAAAAWDYHSDEDEEVAFDRIEHAECPYGQAIRRLEELVGHEGDTWEPADRVRVAGTVWRVDQLLGRDTVRCISGDRVATFHVDNLRPVGG